jgi:hypothetical protein
VPKCLVNELQYGVTVGGSYQVYSLYTPLSWSYSGLYPRSGPALQIGVSAVGSESKTRRDLDNLEGYAQIGDIEIFLLKFGYKLVL